MAKDLKVTSLDAIRAQATSIEELPGWTEDQPFYARVRRLSLISLVVGGHIPNELLSVAQRFISGGRGENPVKSADPEHLVRYGELMQVVARETLMEPTYDEIVEATGGLTDQQLNALFLYSLQGARALELFRIATRANQTASVHGEGVE